MIRNPYLTYFKELHYPSRPKQSLHPTVLESTPMPVFPLFSGLDPLQGFDFQPKVEKETSNVNLSPLEKVALLCEERIDFYTAILGLLEDKTTSAQVVYESFLSIVGDNIKSTRLPFEIFQLTKDNWSEIIKQEITPFYQYLLDLIQKKEKTFSEEELSFFIFAEFNEQVRLLKESKIYSLPKGLCEIIYCEEGKHYFSHQQNELKDLFLKKCRFRGDFIDLSKFYQHIIELNNALTKKMKVSNPQEDNGALTKRILDLLADTVQCDDPNPKMQAIVHARGERIKFIEFVGIQKEILELSALYDTKMQLQKVKQLTADAVKAFQKTQETLKKIVTGIDDLLQIVQKLQLQDSIESKCDVEGSKVEEIGQVVRIDPERKSSSQPHIKKLHVKKINQVPPSLVEQIRVKFEKKQKDIFISIFAESTPHNCLSYHQLKGLVERSGGRIIPIDGSKRRIDLYNFWTSVTEPQLDTMGGVHEPHNTTHNKCSAFIVQRFKDAFVRAGLSPFRLWPEEFDEHNQERRRNSVRHKR